MSEAKSGDPERYSANLRGEIDSATLYRSLAEVEPNPNVAEVYRRLAAVEESHAELWRRRRAALGRQPGTVTGGALGHAGAGRLDHRQRRGAVRHRRRHESLH
jgi:predicted CoA-binding protein